MYQVKESYVQGCGAGAVLFVLVKISPQNARYVDPSELGLWHRASLLYGPEPCAEKQT